MNYQEQLNQAAEKAAKEYLKQQVNDMPEMDSEAQQYCEEDYKQGFLKGAEWRPEPEWDITERALDAARDWTGPNVPNSMSLPNINRHSFKDGYVLAALETQRQILDLQSQSEAKGKAITEALAMIDEKEEEIRDLKAKLKGLYSNSRRN